jgi:hypothetical protein
MLYSVSQLGILARCVGSAEHHRRAGMLTGNVALLLLGDLPGTLGENSLTT